MQWIFTPTPRSQVEVDVTQRDQFDNDTLQLSQTIIREPIQNSLDASLQNWAKKHGKILHKPDEKVKVVFRWVDVPDKVFFQKLFTDQKSHAKKAGLDVDSLDFDNPRALVIEDFGTTGLLGSTTNRDKKDFYGFWRVHGKSDKKSGALGRWGLGKLVYSCTSEIGVFFGLTLRPDDDKQYLMGQTVLNLRESGGKSYPPHAFFSSLEDTHTTDPLTVPCKDEAFLKQFCKNFSVDRTKQTGLSVVIPFPDPNFEVGKMIGTAIANYFYALATKKLVLQFNDIEINHINVRDHAKTYAQDDIKDIDNLFDFIEATLKVPEKNILQVRSTWLDDSKLGPDDFKEKELLLIQSQFEAGELIALWLPVEVKLKDGTVTPTGFYIYLQKPNGLTEGQDLYVRGGLTLPNERKFKNRIALGAMIAKDDVISEMLGYAEDPAHTKWVANSEKLKKNYQNPAKIVSAIKNSIIQLHDIISGAGEERNETALIDFFSYKLPKADPTKKKKKKKKKSITPVVVVPSARPALVKVDRVNSGFKISNTALFDDKKLPKEMSVQVAYDRNKDDAFDKHSPFDFNFEDSDIKIQEKGLIFKNTLPNKITFEVTSLPFNLSFDGFDVNRDLKIKVI
jgi:hypothetical protein